MKILKCFYVFILCFVFLSCTEDDLPETQDPNLFMGVWKLESSMVNDTAETLSECDKENTLILFWFSEADPSYNAEIYTYQANESGECVVIEQILNASWAPSLTFTSDGDATAGVPLTYTLENNMTIILELGLENELLTLQGEMPVENEMVSISRSYRKLRQQVP